MTKLFVSVAAPNHRHYNFRIHVTFNLFQYIHLQSMIISHMSGVFFFDYPAFNKQQQITRYYRSMCVTLLFPRKWKRITEAVKWIQRLMINVLFAYYSVELHLLYEFHHFWKRKLTEIFTGADPTPLIAVHCISLWEVVMLLWNTENDLFVTTDAHWTC